MGRDAGGGGVGGLGLGMGMGVGWAAAREGRIAIRAHIREAWDDVVLRLGGRGGVLVVEGRADCSAHFAFG